MNCCPSFPIILNIVAPFSPILTPFCPSFLPRLPLIDTPLSFLVFPSFHLVFPAFPSPVVLHRLLGSGESTGFLLAGTIGEVGGRGFRRAPVNSNINHHPIPIDMAKLFTYFSTVLFWLLDGQNRTWLKWASWYSTSVYQHHLNTRNLSREQSQEQLSDDQSALFFLNTRRLPFL